MMGAKLPGKDLLGRRPNEATKGANTHRWESFTKRIARLKIDPIHTAQNGYTNIDATDYSHCYFRTALDDWTELNLSATFTSFVKAASPLCETLPQLVHHSDKLFQLLVEHIDKRDKLALEPLLSLTAHFAHDLGREFEKYFARIVSLAAEVAATHEAADVVEWCFTSMAWLFKYLSKLLVPDLRPLLGIMIPYLSHRKEYVSRFSAESLAFLLRKAMSQYSKQKMPLTVALRCLLDSGSSCYQQQGHLGILRLLVESCLGTEGALHSTAENMMQCLLNVASLQGFATGLGPLLEGFVVGLAHRTTSHAFEPIVDVILSESSSQAASGNSAGLDNCLRLMQAAIGTRKGSRIQNWKKVIQATVPTLQRQNVVAKDEEQHRRVLSISALVLQYAPVNELLPFSTSLLELSTPRGRPAEFFSFCALVADLGKERFREFVLPRLQQYILSSYMDDEIGLIYLLQRLHGQGLISREKEKVGFIRSAEAWDKLTLERLSAQNESGLPDECLIAIVKASQMTRFPSRIADNAQLSTLLGEMAFRSFKNHAETPSFRQKLAAGWCLEAAISLENGSRDRFEKYVSELLRASEWCYRLRPFLDACSLVLSKSAAFSDSNVRPSEETLNSLTEIMLTSSTSTKISALRLLRQLGIPDQNHWLSETTRLMLELYDIDYLPANTRKISMLLRRLPQHQKQAASASWAQRLIPNFCIGLLPIYFDQTRRDLCSTLVEVLDESPIQDIFLDILCKWLRSPPHAKLEQVTQPSVSSRLSTFECSNLNHTRILADEAFSIFLNSRERIKALAEEDHQLVETKVPENSRELALDVLSAMPVLAERRSRLFMPIFTSIPFGPATQKSQLPSESRDDSESSCSEPSNVEWTFPDRRAFVRLIRQFQNPKVLYQSTQVREIFISLLQNGNLEMRKLALEGLLKWKDPVLQKNEHIFSQLVEEKASNAEIGVMLNASAEQNPIPREDRETVLPILLRLLYGSIVGRSGSYGSQESRRKSILRMLFRMEQSEVAIFLDIALGTLKKIRIGAEDSAQLLESNLIPFDQQYGFLRLILSLLEILQTQFAPFGYRIVDAVIYCIIRSCRQVDHAEVKTGGLHRNIRRTGLHCLESLFKYCPDIGWKTYLPILFSEAISPRLEAMPAETAQGVSAFLRIFSVWSQHEPYVHFLLDYDARLPGVLWHTLTVNSVKTEVQSYVLNEIIHPLLACAQKDQQSNAPAQQLLVTESDGLMKSLALLLETQPSKVVVAATTTIILELAPLNSQAANSDNILQLLLDLLRDGNSKASPETRGSVVLTVQALLESRQTTLDDATRERLISVIAPLYQYFRDQTSRLCLSQIIKLSSPTDELTVAVASLCESLNALSTERLDEIDYDRRVQGFEDVKSLAINAIPPLLWRPIVFNLVFFSKDEDFTIRSNALSSLKDFICRASDSDSEDLTDFVKQGVLPVVQTGITDDSETIRADMVSVFGLLVQKLGKQLGMQDLEPLLVGSDEEASFFNNIMHIQHHRRARAMRRLASEAEQGRIPAWSISKIFLPLLLKFVKDKSADDSAQSLKGQSIQALSTLLGWVEWKHFKAFFKRTKQELEAEEDVQKTAIKVLMVAAEALTKAWMQIQDPLKENSQLQTRLAATLPSQAELEGEVKSQLLTKLADFIHYREEAEMSARLPAATVAVHLIKLVPANEIQVLAAPVVLDVANVLRSRASESRDAARRTLGEIVKLLGPTSLLFVLKEMQTALKRGYQLHVLSYTLHSILVNMSPVLKMGDLDYCLENMVAVVMDDIFGVVGQEKENQDYISSMKEVKSSKSFDTMEILARFASLSHLTVLLEPIITLLTGPLTSKQCRQVDDLLRRIGIGLAQNDAAGKREVLTFAYQVIERFYKQKASAPPRRPQTQNEANRARFLVKHVSDTKAATASQSSLSYKIARFAIDNVRSTLLKHPELLQPENVAGFLPIIGDALVEGQEDVKISSLRLLSAIIKLQMPELDENAPVYVLEAVRIVRFANSTNDEVAQAALKLVAAVLRERPRSIAAIRDQDIAELLRRVSPDLEEPDRQGVTFNFIRAVIFRKYQLPELYDVVDKIGIMMVTNQTHGARDVARGVYVQFLLDYAQSSARWAKQQKFLIKNLQYEYPEGRGSVMKAINMLVNKTSGEVSQGLVTTFFLPVVLQLANDDIQVCRDLAGALIGQLFNKMVSLAPGKIKDLLDSVRSWVNQQENPSLTRIGMQVYTILFDAVPDGLDAEVKSIKQPISTTLAAGVDHDGDGDAGDDLLHRTLQLLLKLAETRPATAFNQESEAIFQSVRRLLVSHRDVRVQANSASIVAAFFRSSSSSSISRLPLTSTYGLKLDEAGMRELLRAMVHVLKRTEGDVELSNQAVTLLAILGRCIEANGLTMPLKERAEDNDGDSSEEEEQEDDEDDGDYGDDDNNERVTTSASLPSTSIPALQYLLDQCAAILRRETSSLTTASFLPKSSTASLLKILIDQLSTESWERVTTASTSATLKKLLAPLVYLTNTQQQQGGQGVPRSADPTFKTTYTELTTSAAEIMNALQEKLGDSAWVQAMTEVSKMMRGRREERKRKRVIERIAEPEKAARAKRRKAERKVQRKREIGRIYAGRRR